MPARIIEHNNVRYRVRVSVGSSRDPKDQRPLNVNDDSDPVLIDTDEFVGHISFRIKGQDQIQGYVQGQNKDGFRTVPDSQWFQDAAVAGKGANLLNSLQIVGRFKREWSGDQLGIFEQSLKLPPLTSVVLKFFRTLEPSLQIELQCPKPYFASPLLAVMNTVNVSQCVVQDRAEQVYETPHWPSANGESLVEDTSLIFQESKKRHKIAHDCRARRAHFGKLDHQRQHRFLPDHVYGFELFNQYMDCSNLSLKIPGFSIELFKCFNGQMDALSTSSSSSASSSSSSTVTDSKATAQPHVWKSMADSNTRYRLRVLAGPGSNPESFHPLNANDDSEPMVIDTDEFHGYLTFRVKDLDKVPGYTEGQKEDGNVPVPNSKWFDLPASGTKSKNRNGSCLRFGGRFKREWAGDQIIFVAEFDRRIQRLPPCTSAGLKILHFLDPAVKVDLYCDKPYIRSPLIVSMNLVHVSSLPIRNPDAQTQTADEEKLIPPWTSPNGEHVVEDTCLLFKALEDRSKASGQPQETPSTTPVPAASAPAPKSSRQRQHFLAKPKNLIRHRYLPDQMYDFEFTSAGPYIDAANFKVKLAGFSIDLLRFWDGQPCALSVRTADSSVTFFTLMVEPVPVKDTEVK
ncbi:hypothetical protein EC968_003984 [Mortierella alpina]|nr:hypothetical protein EC968_003984 [Mortierella alpina]